MVPSRGIVLGYHGCEESDGRKYIARAVQMPQSSKDYDWLGDGVYFWEWSTKRAIQWAEEKLARGQITTPFVVGAALDLGLCLDLTTTEGITLLAEAFKDFKRATESAGFEMPVNTGGPDSLMRKLDCAVLRWLHTRRSSLKLEQYQSVRALLAEGGTVYPGAGFREKTHTQIAIIDPKCIRGLFAVPPEDFA